MSTRPSILIAGAGPAGCAAAITLARRGHVVRVVTRARPADSGLVVSLPPSVGKVLDLLGVRDRVDTAGFVRTTGNTVWWGTGETRVARFPDGARGWQADVGRLSALLTDEAARAGASIEMGRADDVAPDEAAWRLDATGRAGALARRLATRIDEPDLRSVAMLGVWRATGAWRIPDDTHTLVESYEDGWAWSVPVASGDRHVAVMVDPRASALARGRPADEVYRAELRKAPRLAALLADARLVEGPRGHDASMYHSSRYVAGRTLLIGDAASFVDPLSSSGVRKALVSGWTAGIVVHTCLTRPAMAGAALGYFDTRERDMYDRLRRLARTWLAGAAAGHASPFWDDRQFDDAPAASGSDVQVALERLRAAAAPVLTRGIVSVEPRPAIHGDEVVLEDRVVTPAAPEGVRHVGGIDVLRLLDLAPGARDVGLLYEAYCARAAQAPLDGFLTALATAIACGWLVLADTDLGGRVTRG